ncbi:hypothetical protein [Amnibacterium kyonggiense]|uniref:Uncharacterized protein n=1 Tax=Amnibacterium kyonggiense TaxID=595671 RepID=A0A4R7FIH7_9MICO|nr:hypothetical protein [Amnibacterium kyonggiense]TDS75951.1 hypothetical protein CLV52_3064 [Amnibacterium kyonggiense]
MTDDGDRRARYERFLSEAALAREHPWWRPGAMRPEERERLVRIGLAMVLGDRAGDIRVRRGDEDTIWATDGTHGFGFPIDIVLGDDPRTVLEHDLEWLVDELCETAVAWAKRLPECPLHPDSHPLGLVVSDGLVTASCPVAGETVRFAGY